VAGFEQLGAEVRRIAQEAPQEYPVASAILDKTAIGKTFTSESLEVTFDLRNTKPLADGTTLIRHAPSDGNTIAIQQDINDNSLRIRNESTGNISAWFYPNGRAYVDLTNDAVENRHILAEAVDVNELANLAVTTAKLNNLAVTAGKLNDLSVTNPKIGIGAVDTDNVATAAIISAKLATDSVVSAKIANLQVQLHHINNDAKNQSQGTASLREIAGTGSSGACAASNHTHLSINFNSQYTLAEKQRSADLVTQVQNTMVQPQLEALRQLVLDVARQLMDDPDATVQQKVQLLQQDALYAHEFRMKHDANYYAAWQMRNDPQYAQTVEHDARIQGMAARAVADYGGVEDDPAVVEEYKRRNPRWRDVA
jgi:hypothetical protein